MAKLKKLTIIIAFLFSIVMFAQNKTIVPKTGTIVFIKENKVTDDVAFKKSIKELNPKVMKEYQNQIVFEQLLEGKKVDSIKLKSNMKMFADSFLPFLEMVLQENEKVKIVHDFKKDTIYSTMFEYDNKSTILYDIKSSKIYNKFDNNEISDFYIENITDIKVFRNETKNIKGYTCFKLVYNFKEEESIDYPFQIFKYKREMWVTEDIKFPFLSFIKDDKLLFDFFPLEIVEYMDGIEGLKTTYYIESINLK